MKTLSFVVCLLFTCLSCSGQPYGGTIFVSPTIILPSDSSALVEVTYNGRGSRTIFDRRVNGWVTVNAFRFEVTWNDGLRSEAVVNPEFGTVALARVEAEKYGWHIGQLPYCLRVDVNEIWINRGEELFGGGNNSILIHTGQTANYERDGILEETLVHEACHTSLDAAHAESAGWRAAQAQDGGFISDYAAANPTREDIAESFLLWLAVRFRQDRLSPENFGLITEAIPNRLAYFDEITCDLFPFLAGDVTSLPSAATAEPTVVVYPNPVTAEFQLKTDHPTSYEATIYNTRGEVMLARRLRANQTTNLAGFPSGLYFVVLQKDGRVISRKLVKR